MGSNYAAIFKLPCEERFLNPDFITMLASLLPQKMSYVPRFKEIGL